MEITKSPGQRSPAFGEALFHLTASPEEVVELEILDNTTGALLGKKRFTGQSAYTANVAGYARRLLGVTPIHRITTGFTAPTGRALSMKVRSGSQEAYTTLTTAIVPLDYYMKLTAAPDDVEIGLEDRDEFSLYTVSEMHYAEVVVANTTREVRVRLAQKSSSVGLTSFCFRMPEVAQKVWSAGSGGIENFTTMDLQIVDANQVIMLSRRYRLAVAQPRTLRLCWWNRFGQIDYYSFMESGASDFRVEKERIYTAGGYKTIACEAETATEAVTGYLNRATLGWLKEIVAAPRVWLDRDNTFIPVEITSQRVTTGAGQMGRMELSFVPVMKTRYQNL